VPAAGRGVQIVEMKLVNLALELAPVRVKIWLTNTGLLS
jgi:hypothetical protein